MNAVIGAFMGHWRGIAGAVSPKKTPATHMEYMKKASPENGAGFL